eukprot:139668-Pleurochrysis_carterae.AAC.1
MMGAPEALSRTGLKPCRSECQVAGPRARKQVKFKSYWALALESSKVSACNSSASTSHTPLR